MDYHSVLIYLRMVFRWYKGPKSLERTCHANHLLEIEATSHMSKEVQNTAVVVPRAIVSAIFISGLFATGFFTALLFSIGHIASTLESPTQFPIIKVLYVATQSKAVTTFMCLAIVFTLVFATFGTLASASRLNRAFARENGFQGRIQRDDEYCAS